MKKNLLFIVILFVSGFIAGQAKVVDMGTDKAGMLVNEIPEPERASLTELTLSGNINAVDFKFMRDQLPLLEMLHIGAVHIVEYEGTGGTEGISGESSEEAVHYAARMIPEQAFFQKSTLREIVFPQELIAVGYSAFSSSGLVKADFSETKLERIDGGSSFYDCQSLESISLPATLKYIAEYSFYLTPLLSSFTCHVPDPVQIDEGVTGMFGIIYKTENGEYIYDDDGNLIVDQEYGAPDCTLYVPETSIELYKNADSWKLFGSVEAIKGDVTPPEPDVTELTIDMSGKVGSLVTEIPEKDRNTLRKLTLSGDINAVDFKFIRDMLPGLEELDLSAVDISTYEGEEGTYIDLWAIDQSLPVSYLYPDNMIPYAAFYGGAEKLHKIVFPTSITGVEDMAFMNHPAITEIDFTECDELAQLGYLSFSDCRSLSNIILPASITNLGQYTFQRLENATVTCLAPDPSMMGSASGLFGLDVSGTPEEPVYSESKTVETCTLLVPEASLELYKNAEVWKNFGTIKEMTSVGLNPESDDDFTLYGGKGYLTVGCNKDMRLAIYSLTGALVGEVNASAGQTNVLLPAGIYIVNKQKVIIR